MMHLPYIGMLALLMLTACAQTAPPDRYPMSGSGALPALDWRTWTEGREVFVELEDPSGYYDTVTMELVAPGGQVIPAGAVTHEERRYRGWHGGPSVGLGGATGSRRGGGIGVGVSVPVGGDRARTGHRDRRIVGRFVVPDFYSYRRTASDWEIVVRLTTPSGETSRATIPAPLV